MNKKDYQTPCTKFKRFTSEHPFMEWTDWADSKEGIFFVEEEEDDGWNTSNSNVWDD